MNGESQADGASQSVGDSQSVGESRGTQRDAWPWLVPIVVFLFAGPAVLAIAYFGEFDPLGYRPHSTAGWIIHGFLSPMFGWLVVRRHPRARLATYVFLSREIIRAVVAVNVAGMAIAIAVIVYMQLPGVRRALPSIVARDVVARLRRRGTFFKRLLRRDVAAEAIAERASTGALSAAAVGHAGDRVPAIAAVPAVTPGQASATPEPPALVSWNLTRACNLRCPHCYLDAGRRADDELSTFECLDVVDQLAELGTEMLILTGGEPLLRTDLVEVARHAAGRGMIVTVGTNGLLLELDMAERLVEAGVSGVALSVDSTRPERHDEFRGVSGAFAKTVRAMHACRSVGLDFIVQASLGTWNRGELADLAAFARSEGARAFNAYFLVCTGRGEELTDITAAEHDSAIDWLVKNQASATDGMMVRAKCAPHAARVAVEQGVWLGGSAGCIAGTSYLRIDPRGDVTPCPYMPEVIGNVRQDRLRDLWESAPVLGQLRHRELEGRCGVCDHRSLCGGCRARALASQGNLLAADPWCSYENDGQAELVKVLWTAEAKARMARAPSFIRKRIMQGVEAFARQQGRAVVTPELLTDFRARAGIMPHGKPNGVRRPEAPAPSESPKA